MQLSYDYFSSVITVDRESLPIVSTDPYEVREFDVEEMHSILRAAEASETGIVYKDTHNWAAAKFIGGVDLAPVHEMINGYTVTFEPGIYAVKLIGANNNVVDVMNINTVSTQTANSAGLIKVNTGGGGDGGSTDLTPVTDQLDVIEGKIDVIDNTTQNTQATVNTIDTNLGVVDATVNRIETKVDGIVVSLESLDVNVDLTPISAQLDVVEGKVDNVPDAVWAYTGPVGRAAMVVTDQDGNPLANEDGDPIPDS